MHSVFLDSEGRVRCGWKALLFFVAYEVLTGVLVIPVVLIGLAMKADVRSLLEFKLGPLLGAVAGLAVTWLFIAVERNPLHSVGLKLNRRWAREATLGALGGILLMVLTALVMLALGAFHWTRNPGGHFGGILGGFLLFLFVGINEEVAFRGYPFQRLVAGIGPWPTQALLALFFAAIHWSNPGIRDSSLALKAWTTLNIALAAVLLGLCYLKTRSLALPIGLHLGWNWAQGYLLGFQVSGTTEAQGFWKPILADRPQWLTGGAVGLEGSAICTVILVVAILPLALWKPKEPEMGQA